MAQSIPNPALEGLQALVGEWTIEIPQYPEVHGWMAFESMEGGAFLVQHADPKHPPFPSSTAIIGGDESTDTYCMLYFDSRGVSRVYHMSLSDGVWKIWRQAPGFSQRFVGTLTDDGRIIKGRSEKSADDSHWEHDFDLIYTKVR